MRTIKINYAPRPYFMRFHMRSQRWAILVAHRRAGKTVAAINDIVSRAARNTLPFPQYAYVAPLLNQAKKIAWRYLKEAVEPFGAYVNESELYVELRALPNSPKIQLFGADNPDAIRGMYLDGIVLDEFGNMVDSFWQAVVRPLLADRRGWAVFMGTPNGPNHFRDRYYKHKDDPAYLVELLPYNVTNILHPEEIEEMRESLDPELFAQELLCSFEASVRGAIYARQIEQMQEQGRIDSYNADKLSPVDVVMDLGWRDATAIGFVQPRPDGLLMLHAHSDSMRPIKHYIDYIKEFTTSNGLKLGTIHLPHDAKAKSLQTGKSIIENFRTAGLRPKLVPELDLLDGIAAARLMFPKWYINEPLCQSLILALKSYRRKYNEELKTFGQEPVHDWSSHLSDMWRYASIVFNTTTETEYAARRGGRSAPPPTVKSVNYGFALNDLWSLQPQRSERF